MNNAEFIVVLITTGSQEEAEKITTALLNDKKVACVNIIDAQSSFWWEDTLEKEKEKLLIAKSRASLLADIVESVKMTHSYEIPEIIALPLLGGNPDYLDWIKENTREK